MPARALAGWRSRRLTFATAPGTAPRGFIPLMSAVTGIIAPAVVKALRAAHYACRKIPSARVPIGKPDRSSLRRRSVAEAATRSAVRRTAVTTPYPFKNHDRRVPANDDSVLRARL